MQAAAGGSRRDAEYERGLGRGHLFPCHKQKHIALG
jgi:hypothetical protein